MGIPTWWALGFCTNFLWVWLLDLIPQPSPSDIQKFSSSCDTWGQVFCWVGSFTTWKTISWVFQDLITRAIWKQLMQVWESHAESPFVTHGLQDQHPLVSAVSQWAPWWLQSSICFPDRTTWQWEDQSGLIYWSEKEQLQKGTFFHPCQKSILSSASCLGATAPRGSSQRTEGLMVSVSASKLLQSFLSCLEDNVTGKWGMILNKIIQRQLHVNMQTTFHLYLLYSLKCFAVPCSQLYAC